MRRWLVLGGVCLVIAAGVWLWLARRGEPGAEAEGKDAGAKAPEARARRRTGTGTGVETETGSGGSSGTGAGAETRTGTLAGRVVDRTTREAVAGVDVMVKARGREIAVVSGADGRFSATAAAGAVEVRVLGDMVYGAPRRVIVGGEPVEVEIEVERLGMVRGRVIDQERQPVIGATVSARVPEDLPRRTVREDLGHEVQSGADGAFEIAVLPGDVRLIADREGVQGFARVGRLAPGARKNGVTIQLEPTTSVAGIVRAPDGRPVENALVRAAVRVRGTSIRQEAAARSDPNGEWTITGVMVGYAYLEARHAGVGPSPELRVNLRPGGRIRGIELRLTEPVTLAGRVLDEGGRPVAEAEVRVDPAGSRFRSGSVYTDEDGRFQVQELGRGRHTVGVYKEGMAPSIRDDVEVPGALVEVVLLAPP